MMSTRLPGKVLMDLVGRPMLVQQLRRLKRCRLVDEIVVATTTNNTDNPIVALADAEGVRWFRGSENDVLSRYVGAAREAKADVIVRTTADCPLIDSEISDQVIRELVSHVKECDYASNVVRRTFPQGLDTEAFFSDTLERLNRLGHSAPSREHVTYFILRARPDLFVIRSVTDSEDNSDLRWTVDTIKDLDFVRRIYEELALDQRTLSYHSVLKYVRKYPTLMAINAHVAQPDATRQTRHKDK